VSGIEKRSGKEGYFLPERCKSPLSGGGGVHIVALLRCLSRNCRLLFLLARARARAREEHPSPNSKVCHWKHRIPYRIIVGFEQKVQKVAESDNPECQECAPLPQPGNVKNVQHCPHTDRYTRPCALLVPSSIRSLSILTQKS